MFRTVTFPNVPHRRHHATMPSSCACRRAQGDTIKDALVYLCLYEMRQRGQAYVALSRQLCAWAQSAMQCMCPVHFLNRNMATRTHQRRPTPT